jgi:hypothetical protein
MTVRRLRAPPASPFLGDLRHFYHWDSHDAPLRHGELGMVEIYHALFAHHPPWARGLLRLRDWLVRPFGLKPSMKSFDEPIRIQSSYAVGDRMARFVLFSQSDREIVTGGDDRHLDFRVSVRRLEQGGGERIVLSTVVSPHNFLGKAYLFVVLPFHYFGIRKMLANAVYAGRI